MNAPTRVLDSSPLIAFERIGEPEVPEKLLGSAFIPPAVRQEVFGDDEPPGWLQERALTQPLPPRILGVRLGAGEREAIALAMEIDADQVFLDDLAARRLAKSLGLRVVGTLTLILEAKAAGIIPAVRPALNQLRTHGFRLADDLVNEVLSLAGE